MFGNHRSLLARHIGPLLVCLGFFVVVCLFVCLFICLFVCSFVRLVGWLVGWLAAATAAYIRFKVSTSTSGVGMAVYRE